MIKDIQNKKIYVYCLASVVTGGCELLHQLVDFLNDNHRDAYIVYIGKGAKKVPEAYSAYNIKVANEIEDSEGAVVVLDEGFLYLADNFKKAHLIFWWLSVDNFFADPVQLPYHSLKDLFKWNKKTFVRALLKGSLKEKRHFSVSKLAKQKAVNAYQSEYARLFLKKNGFKEIVPLKDYINTEYFNSETSCKENIVLYNPKKGYKFTSKLIASAPDITWIPLINLNRQQMLDYFKRAKVYIDFGNHPGKDRIPREAAINNSVVITGVRGSAGNDIDIPIPAKYKFDENVISRFTIITRIKEIFDNFDDALSDQLNYRNHIKEEKKEFENQIRTLFEIK